ncbi:MAG: hypothetical protein HQ483_02870 [Rhodospirillales bacterium]|nr:hypothetical protein [Rhodospirillales bacterium]
MHDPIKDLAAIRQLKPPPRNGGLVQGLIAAVPTWLVAGSLLFPMDLYGASIQLKFFAVVAVGIFAGFCFIKIIGGSSASQKARHDSELRNTLKSEREKQLREYRRKNSRYE